MNRWRSGAFIRSMPFAAVLLTGPMALAQDGAGATTARGGGDHDMFIGHVGFGWLGTRDIPAGVVTAANPAIPTPAVGVRYWATPMLGIDVGLGFFMTSGSTNTQPQPPGMTVDAPSRTTFLIHGGVPLALASAGHFSFQVTPELDVGFGTGTIKPAPVPPPGVTPPNTDLSGFLLQVGARVGGEVYFGFIGIPQLSLDASVGVFLQSTNAKTAVTPASQKVSNLRIATSSVAQPWDIFRSNIAARYYF